MASPPLGLDELFENAPGYIAVVRGPEHVFEVANAAYRRLVGEREIIGKRAKDVLPELEAEGYLHLLDEVFRSGEPYVADSARVTIDGAVHYISFVYQPIKGEDGQVSGIFAEGVDVTQARKAEEALRESRAASERQRLLYEAILSNTPDLAYIFDLDHRFIYANEGLLRMWGKSWEEAIGKTCLELGYEPWHAEMHDREIERVIATKQPIRGNVPFTGTYGRRVYDYIFVPVLSPDGEVVAVAGTTRDVTEYREAEERQALLLEELNHRVKNTLAIVQALAHQTLQGAAVPSEAGSAFEGRLRALAAAHDVLTRGQWQAADLGDIVRESVGACAALGSFKVEGPPVPLEPRAAVTVSMALHELCTNALKYGALSELSGTVSVSWHTVNGSAPRLVIRWEESGGPAVQPPRQRGFGSRMLQRALAADLKAEVRLDFRPEGLVCEVDAPLASRSVGPQC